MIRPTSVDAVPVLDSLRKFTQEVGRELLAEVLLTARNLAVSLGHSTQPYGMGIAAKQAGEKRVAADIRRVFISPSAFYGALEKEDPKEARRFWAAWKARDTEEMERIVPRTRAGSGLEVLAVPSKMMHQERRAARGRVYGKRPSALVTDGAALAGYIRTVQQRVGTAKDGWADAAAECGGTAGFPVWASSRHPGRHGGATILPDPESPRVEIRNDVPWIREALPEKEEIKAIDIAEDRLLKRMEIIVQETTRATIPF